MEIIRLVKQAKQGDKEALIELVMSQKEAYYKLAYVLMRDKEEALDSLQDMIVLLYDNIKKLKKEEAFYSWSKTILMNRCKKKLKDKRKFISLEAIREQGNWQRDFNTGREGSVLQKEEELLLEEALSQLKSKHQEVIRLRYFLDLDYETMSTLLGIPLGTVKSRLAIGLKVLQKIIGGENDEKG
ncbi:RNA polymerase subunit sigma-24 [Sporanaerobium hydrogeniformans]|uniref:RNA polymerase subunit sigma-24 n=1 Tax=Sporanaerobium hydrogeniformans TaxID=3072179 RepID=A0AC61D9E0_9FIRM|nr:sigma-70 family RNA polymerase sigma factor [Sporanaerobium hydrogeniformans]PHV69321.1 RNA polymerase subunit sigma-24 [Sporanaerobium hydrogeniformans]